MSDKELMESREAMKKLREDLTSSPEKAQEFLVRAGILTPEGELTEPYRKDA